MVRASILGPRIDENRRREARKALKLRKNIVFGRNRFFIVFLMHFSMNFGSPGRPRGRPKSTVPLIFSTFLLACRFRAAPGVSWDRFGSIFHRFSVDFGTILAWFFLVFFCQFAVVLLPILGQFWIVFFCTRTLSNVLFDRLREKKTLIRATKKRVQWMNEWMNEWMKLY